MDRHSKRGNDDGVPPLPRKPFTGLPHQPSPTHGDRIHTSNKDDARAGPRSYWLHHKSHSRDSVRRQTCQIRGNETWHDYHLSPAAAYLAPRCDEEAVRAETEIKVDASQAWYLAMMRLVRCIMPALDTTSIQPQSAQRGN
ncbi:hypothetical protein VF21_03364 [Pseudogymnoascus sp. 05NY08]|nr:hypothetical protein VF21_03364 [Pseudogymnoascus sp. 05NY08]